MGYQPGLDGLRAFAVISILLYHAGFEWMSGAFISIDLFFLLSGFLITALLLGEALTFQSPGDLKNIGITPVVRGPRVH